MVKQNVDKFTKVLERRFPYFDCSCDILLWGKKQIKAWVVNTNINRTEYPRLNKFSSEVLLSMEREIRSKPVLSERVQRLIQMETELADLFDVQLRYREAHNLTPFGLQRMLGISDYITKFYNAEYLSFCYPIVIENLRLLRRIWNNLTQQVLEKIHLVKL